MPFSRQRPRFSARDRATIRLGTWQRDLFLENRRIPASLAFALKRAPVREGKLSVRVSVGELESLIAAVAKTAPQNKSHERELNAFLGYLESIEDRFEHADGGEE